MKVLESYKKGVIVNSKDKLYRVEGFSNKKQIKKAIDTKKYDTKVIDNRKQEDEIKNLKDMGIILDIKQVYIKGYPEVYAFMAPICCPHGEHPDIAGGISLDKDEALHKTIGEAIERYYLFNFKPTKKFKKVDIFSYMNDLGISYFSKSQSISKTLKGTKNIGIGTGYSLISEKKLEIPYSFIHCPYKPTKGEDSIGEGTSTGCSAHRTRELAILNGIMECIERHVNMKIWYNKITPPKINIDSIKDPEIQYMIKLLNNNGVKLDILNTTSLNDYGIPSVMIVCKHNAGGINALITASCKPSLRGAIIKALEEAFQGQTRGFLMNKYPNFKPGKNYSNVKYFYQHILFYANKKTEKILGFLFKKNQTENYKNIEIKNSIPEIKKLFKKLGKDCYIVDIDCQIPGFYVNKVILPGTYQLSRDHSQRFLSNLTKKYNKYPHPFG